MDFSTKLNAHLARIEPGIDQLLPPVAASGHAGPRRIHEAMRYSMQAGGKRLRPVLVLAAAELFGEKSNALPAAIAIECVHTYSLIHDDLPCMDNDDLRRGRPTAHKKFDEATALLAGDALLTHAFALLAENYAPPLVAEMVRELATAAGSAHLIGGQMEDLLAEKKADATAAELEFIHLSKTAAMIKASLALGGCCGSATKNNLGALHDAGHHLGLAFQIIDDILDATADTATLGKTAGKDAKTGKTTFVKLHGLGASRRFAREHTDAACASLDRLPGDKTFLTALIQNMSSRSK
ncbi:MAG TPA: farnesyl diphosphate synthase [Opitutaceae bacterium]|jgi:geranylgeranyl diphosphate synthase type II|nr:farnesyl diphosphate synthase [Opitutaceae bacterium]